VKRPTSSSLQTSPPWPPRSSASPGKAIVT
jgi:hypothetical protein